MKPIRIILALTAALGLSACATVETASRNVPIHAAPAGMGLTTGAPAEAYQIVGVDVTVPRDLHVSEANTFRPRADVVWREDPLGNRYEQIELLIADGLTPLVGAQAEGRAVIVDVQISRFHALTQKTRYTVGGTHDLHFFVSVKDATTGQVLQAPRMIETELQAYGGAAALEAMSRGETQKRRIQRHMRQVIGEELYAHIVPAAPAPPMQLSALSSRGI